MTSTSMSVRDAAGNLRDMAHEETGGIRTPRYVPEIAGSAVTDTNQLPVGGSAIGAVAETAPASDTASSGLNGRLQRIAQRLTSLIALFPASVGQKAKAGSLSVALASDDDLLAKIGEVQASPTANTVLDRLKTSNAALGAPADAEATGDGTLIGLLKRIRTLLARPLLTETLTATPIVAAAAAVQVIAANANRKTLDLINTGTGTIYYGYSSAVTASTGYPLAPAGSANDQGGSYQWALGHAPAGALYVFSAAGSTVIVKEGV